MHCAGTKISWTHFSLFLSKAESSVYLDFELLLVHLRDKCTYVLITACAAIDSLENRGELMGEDFTGHKLPIEAKL